MKKFKTGLLKTFSPLANEIGWPIGSNIRGRNSIKNCDILEEDSVNNVSEIRRLVKKLYEKFNYTKDGVDQLFDAITPPAQNYSYYLSGSVKDDCDGFHSLVYHCVAKSNILCYLLSVVSNEGGHCVLVFNLNNKGYVNDYTKIYTGCSTLKEAVEEYNKQFLIRYTKSETSEVVYNGFVEYNYDKGKFRSVKHELKELLK